jgi:hypothetical protein
MCEGVQITERMVAQQWETCRRRELSDGESWRVSLEAEANGTAQYWPEYFIPAPLRALQASEQPFAYVDDSEMGWGWRSEGGVEMYEINFDHEELLREPT